MSGHHAVIIGASVTGLVAARVLSARLQDDLKAAGAVTGDVIGGIRWFQHGHYKAKFHSGLGGLLLSRPLLESRLREHVSQLANVTIVDGLHVMGLVTDHRRRQISGVRVLRAGQGAAVVDADLVIDASGRASRSTKWLEVLGYAAPSAEAVDVGLGL
jgi:2-polyprenyl-6-methoxyphenol hydroxylase-like FAD-dependent oxidoreductase